MYEHYYCGSDYICLLLLNLLLTMIINLVFYIVTSIYLLFVHSIVTEYTIVHSGQTIHNTHQIKEDKHCSMEDIFKAQSQVKPNSRTPKAHYLISINTTPA